MKLDLLAIGVHPDDIELSCAGTILTEVKNGKKVGIVDLTQGELGTRGTAQTRKEEAEESAKILRVSVRENLKMADGFFKNDREHQLKVVQVLRKYRPDIIMCNAQEDRHPDHGRAAALVEEAAFLSGLRKVETMDGDMKQEAWRPAYIFNYIQDRYFEPDFVVDISDVIDEKIKAIQAFKSQFFNTEYNSDEPQTYISSPEFLNTIVGRTQMWGKSIGVKHAEGFLSKKMLGVKGFNSFIQQTT